MFVGNGRCEPVHVTFPSVFKRLLYARELQSLDFTSGELAFTKATFIACYMFVVQCTFVLSSFPFSCREVSFHRVLKRWSCRFRFERRRDCNRTLTPGPDRKVFAFFKIVEHFLAATHPYCEIPDIRCCFAVCCGWREIVAGVCCASPFHRNYFGNTHYLLVAHLLEV